MKGTLAVLAVFALGAVVALESEWNQAARDHILDVHNEYRRNEGGCQINKLEYDMELEAQAKKWAEGCVFEHEMIKGRGENLAFSTYEHPENIMISDSAQGWFDEKNDFTRGQHGCQRSCHYTQLVWDTTEKVGCYSTRCPSLGKTSASNAWYFVCFYTPMGNTIGQEPYALSCETPCRNGQTEEDGLCVGEVIVPCVDDNEKCAGWAGRGQCDSNPDYMGRYCRKSCKICESGDEPETEEGSEEGGESEGESETGGSEEGGSEEGAETGGSTEEGAETGEGAEPAVCKDDNAHCMGWAASDQCTINPLYMLANCRKSCKVCEGGEEAGECDNKDERCEQWASTEQCTKNPGYMLNHCRKACNKC
ncbi:cysteine-rich venom protein [Elysia marginata]|uniref:Cysteine-rich venom protein n=1 Tax=Elysia marginata TaxID=1093978 RepID=A0AAV4GRM3_9GAST|nr:cysteine-rich venom protein [Elysia marginata]